MRALFEINKPVTKKPTAIVIASQQIPEEIIRSIISMLLNNKNKSAIFSSIFSLCSVSQALNSLLSSIEFIHSEKKRICQQKLRDSAIPSVMTRYCFVFWQHQKECGNDYGRAIYMLGNYCSLFSANENYNGWANRTEGEIKLVNFLKCNWNHNHMDIVKQVVIQHYYAGSWGARATLSGDYEDVKKLLNDLKTALISKATEFNRDGALAGVINDIQILCRINVIDVIQLSEEISCLNSVNNKQCV